MSNQLENGVIPEKIIKEKFFSAKRMAKLGIFTALAFALYMIKIPLSFIFPAFLELNLSDLPALIGGFALGPISAVIIVFVKCVIKLPFSTTVCVGELADFLIGVSLVLPASLIYKYNKTKKGALTGILVGSLCSILVGVLANWLILIPFYLTVMKYKLSDLVYVCGIVIKGITEKNFFLYYLSFAVLPFNVVRCLISGIITFFTYKRISKLLHKM